VRYRTGEHHEAIDAQRYHGHDNDVLPPHYDHLDGAAFLTAAPASPCQTRPPGQLPSRGTTIASVGNPAVTPW
jgi:hypothetical protein